jgi:hypothetical protein
MMKPLNLLSGVAMVWHRRDSANAAIYRFQRQQKPASCKPT